MTNLVLLPGLLSDRELWADQLAHFPNAIVPVLEADTPEGMVEAVMAVAPPTFALAGHSMGGWVALEVLKRYPERVIKLCIIATSADKDSEEALAARRGMVAQFGDEVIDMLVDFLVAVPEVKPKVREMFQRNRHAFANQQAAMIARESSLDLLPTITHPTLVIGASEDERFLASTKEIAKRIPGAQLEIVEGCGHMIPMEKPEIVTQLMTSCISSV